MKILKTNYFGDLQLPNKVEWWLMKLQFWKYKEVIKGVLIKK